MAAAIQALPIKLLADFLTLPVMYKGTYDPGDVPDGNISISIDNTRTDGFIGIKFPGQSDWVILIDKVSLQAAVLP